MGNSTDSTVLHDDVIDDLESDFDEKEITFAVSQMSKDKSPGLDALRTEFYQKFWPIIKDDLKKWLTNVKTEVFSPIP